jgi:hypothetical protein
MQNKKLIRFVESFLLLPIMTISTPSLGNIPQSSTDTVSIPQIVLKKENIVTEGLLALNQVLDAKVNVDEVRANAIDSYFKEREMPLSGYGAKMVEEANKNDLDWRLLPAISVRESTGGKFACKKVKFNPFGWGSCKIGFDSYDKAIETVARNLGGNNPKTKQHYDNKTTEEILKAYNPPSIVPKYVPQVMKIMDAIGEIDLGEEKSEA